ncbi:hypothetical protein [Streptomyces sp. NPDC004528]|uniref:hypothetical protein n=1 Tax=Streptomyces sp. NPDC004528 TaxID=3154550 RepID=UPI0033A6C106
MPQDTIAPAPFSAEEKAASARVIVEAYSENDPDQGLEDVVVDLVADLMHFVASIGGDVESVLEQARKVYGEER